MSVVLWLLKKDVVHSPDNFIESRFSLSSKLEEEWSSSEYERLASPWRQRGKQ